MIIGGILEDYIIVVGAEHGPLELILLRTDEQLGVTLKIKLEKIACLIGLSDKLKVCRIIEIAQDVNPLPYCRLLLPILSIEYGKSYIQLLRILYTAVEVLVVLAVLAGFYPLLGIYQRVVISQLHRVPLVL